MQMAWSVVLLMTELSFVREWAETQTLGPETAESTQFGVILNPIQDLSVTIDWWDYEIENTIGTIGAGSILGNCYFNADS